MASASDRAILRALAEACAPPRRSYTGRTFTVRGPTLPGYQGCREVRTTTLERLRREGLIDQQFVLTDAGRAAIASPPSNQGARPK